MEDEDGRDRRRIRLGLERGQHRPEDREEDEQRDDVREQVQPERGGLDAKPAQHGVHDVSPRLKVRVSSRSRSAAMIELKTIASTPCADDEPTSLACEIVW